LHFQCRFGSVRNHPTRNQACSNCIISTNSFALSIFHSLVHFTILILPTQRSTFPFSAQQILRFLGFAYPGSSHRQLESQDSQTSFKRPSSLRLFDIRTRIVCWPIPSHQPTLVIDPSISEFLFGRYPDTTFIQGTFDLRYEPRRSSPDVFSEFCFPERVWQPRRPSLAPRW